MLMTTKIILDTKDIRRVLAEYFKVSEDQVEVSTVEECTGYGMGETYIHIPHAEITKEIKV